MEEVRPHVADGTDQQAPSRPPFNGQSGGRCVLVLYQVIGAGDEVQKGVLLL